MPTISIVEFNLNFKS